MINEEKTHIAEKKKQIVTTVFEQLKKMPEKYNELSNQIDEYKKKYTGLLAEDEKTYADVKEAKKKVATLRIDIEAYRKEISKPIRGILAEIKEQADGYLLRIEEIEEPLKLEKDRWEDAIKAEEEQRISAIQEKLSFIKNQKQSSLSESVGSLRAKLDILERCTVDDSFEEFKAEAESVRFYGIKKLSDAIEAKENFDETQAKLAEIAKQQEEKNRLEQEKLKAQQEELKAQQEEAARQKEENERAIQAAIQRTNELEKIFAEQQARRIGTYTIQTSSSAETGTLNADEKPAVGDVVSYIINDILESLAGLYNAYDGEWMGELTCDGLTFVERYGIEEDELLNKLNIPRSVTNKTEEVEAYIEKLAKEQQ
jgi:chromosome segregation ATPase